MFREGVISEVKKFLKLNIKKDKSPNKIIGINEIKRYLRKEIDLKLTKELIAIKTRQYAKRQNTWARNKMLSWNQINFHHVKGKWVPHVHVQCVKLTP